MKLFIKNFLLFLLSIIALSYPLDKWISSTYKSRNTDELSVWNDIYEGNIDDQMIINGSSSAWVHIDPMMIEEQTNVSCYNLGLNGHNFPLQYFRYLEFRKYNPKPKIIIQEIEGGSFSIDTLGTFLEQLMPYMLYDEDIRKHTKISKRFNLLDFYLPCFRYYGEIEKIYAPIDTAAIRVKGYKGQNIEWNTDFENDKKKMNGYILQIDSTILTSFENYVRECQRENIKIILVHPPIHIDGQNFVTNYEQGIEWLKAMSKKHNISFYNFSQDTLCYQKKYYYNTRHLNKEGSFFFTKKLIPIIKKEIQGMNLNRK
jgi:hypothetical protein